MSETHTRLRLCSNSGTAERNGACEVGADKLSAEEGDAPNVLRG